MCVAKVQVWLISLVQTMHAVHFPCFTLLCIGRDFSVHNRIEFVSLRFSSFAITALVWFPSFLTRIFIYTHKNSHTHTYITVCNFLKTLTLSNSVFLLHSHWIMEIITAKPKRIRLWMSLNGMRMGDKIESFHDDFWHCAQCEKCYGDIIRRARVCVVLCCADQDDNASESKIKRWN